MTAPAIVIASPDGSTRAKFLPGANLVCSELRMRGRDWLDPIRALEAVETGKDYGISLVHPWAGRLSGFEYTAAGRHVRLSPGDPRIKLDKQGLPIHGVWDRLLHWEVESADAGGFVARLDWDDESLLDVYPFPHRLRVTATLSSGLLSMTTQLEATGAVPVPVTFGYHAFLRIPDSSRADWRLALGADERLLQDERLIPNGHVESVGEHEFLLGQVTVNDDYRVAPEPARFAIRTGPSEIELTLREGFRAVHVWAPSDRNLVSFEPSTAIADQLVRGDALPIVQPGGRHVAGFDLRLSEGAG